MMISESYQTHISEPVVTISKTNYMQGENIVINGWVNYNEEPTSDVLLRITITDPKGVGIFNENIISSLDGTFSLDVPISKNAEVGRYVVEIISQCREIHRDICTHQSETITINVENGTDTDPIYQGDKIPGWVKNIFVWYAENKVSENELLSAIEFLINQNIIQIKTGEK